MTGNEIRTALRNGDPVFATLVVSESPHWLGMIEHLCLDFVFIDTEHIPLDRSTLSWMCRAYASRGLPSMVRISSPDPYQACTACRRHGKGVGIHTISPALRKRGVEWARKGANLFVHSADIIAASEKLAEDLHASKQHLGLASGAESPTEISI